jgi:hypothetical protein
MHGDQARKFAEDVVYGTANDRQEALGQALEEQKKYGFDEGTMQMRVQELVDEKRFARAPELADETHRFALHSTYREGVPGFLGGIARKLNDFKDDHPSLGLVVPFVNLPANVANEFLNWTPIGIWRGRDALPWRDPNRTAAVEDMYKDVPGFAKLVESGGVSDSELRDMAYEYLAKGVIGTLGMAALGAITVANKDNPDAPLAVTGAGPSDAAHRDQLRATGWQPYALKVGNMYFQYQASPWKSALGLIGGLSDQIKYGKEDPAEGLFNAIVNVGLQDSLSTITDASFLQGLQAVMAMSGHGREAAMNVNQFLSQEASSLAMIPFGGTGTRQIYRAFEPQTFGANYRDVGEMILRNIPVLNSAFLQPKLNVLGEPVDINPLNRLVPTMRTEDQVYRFLDAHNIGLTLPAASTRIDGVQVTPGELYDLTKFRGTQLRAAITDAMNNAEFRSLPPDEMEQQIKDLEREATDDAKEHIREQRAQQQSQ